MKKLLVVFMTVAVATVFADTPKFEDFKVKLTGVAVVSANAEDDKGVTPLPPQTRVVVTPGNEALFYLEYSFPTNVTPLMFLLANFDDDVLDSLSPFGIYASGVVSGVGKSKMRLGMEGALVNKPYEEEMLLKSVRIKCMLLPEKGAPSNKAFVICDAPVNVLFANKADSDGKGAVVLPPVPTPQPDLTLGIASLAKEEKPKLIKKYGINRFPTALILDGDGNKVGETGVRKGGAKPYAEHLLDIKKKR